MLPHRKKWWTIALAGVLVLAIFGGLCACAGPDGPKDQPKDGIRMTNADGSMRYRIVRGEYAAKTVTTAAAEFRLRLMEELHVENVEISDDWVDADADVDGVYEILIGEVNRQQSRDALAALGEDQYSVSVDGNKIVLIGCDDAHTVMAIRYFLSQYVVTDAEDGTKEDEIVIPKDLKEVRTEKYVPVVADGAQLIETVYSTDDVVVADIRITAEAYGVDPTGEADSTAGIQKALDKCSKNGGGTVFLPVGTYRITSDITVPAFVTLRGDWQDPDRVENNCQYGTVILADVKSEASGTHGLFNLGGSAGVIGLTVYYPNQSLSDVKPYPSTFFAVGGGVNFMLSTVKNCTVINAYIGIGATIETEAGHEQLTVENFRGTCLKTGLALYHSSDVGTCTNISILPRYWVDFAKTRGYEVPDADALKAYTRANADGFEIADVEWTQFTHITLSDLRYGIHTVEAVRINFAGCFYDTVVLNTDYAVKLDGMDSRWGAEFSNCYLEGSVLGMENNTVGVVKTAGTSIIGGLQGTILVDKDSLKEYAVDTGETYTVPKAELYVTDLDKSGKTDVSSGLQDVLNLASETGGVVYLPAGTYRLDQPVEVPAGVELRGCSSVATRDQNGLSAGTMIAAYYGVGGTEQDQALITLNERAGVNGIRIYYPTNGSSVMETSYAIRGKGAQVYVVNSCIVSAGRGVDFSGCDQHLIKKLTSFCFLNDIRVGGKDGRVIGFLHNATVRMRVGFPRQWEDRTDYRDANYVARDYCTSIQVDGAENEWIWDVFSYGVATMVKATASKNTRVIQIGTDNIGDTTPQMHIVGGDFTAINIMRYNGHSYDAENGAKVTLYSRLAINDKTEGNVKQ